MLIKECLKSIPQKDGIKVVVFEGDKENFYTWLEYTTKKETAHLVKIELMYDPSTKQVKLQLILDSIKKGYSTLVQEIVQGIKGHYEMEIGTPLLFSTEKSYRKKEVLLDLFSLK